MKYVLVTGASGGMGRAAVAALSRKGWFVFALDRALPEGGERILPLTADVTSEESLALAKEAVAKVTPRLDALATAVAGKARGFVLEGWQALTDALSGRWEHGGTVYYTDGLCTGDCLYLVDTELPDFWFEETDDGTRDAETVTDPESGETLTLRVLDYGSGLQLGLLHVLESGVPLGDLTAALDTILAIQDTLIGGGV